MALLEHSIRQDLNETAERRLAVLRPLKVIITNFEEGKVEELEAVNNPKNPEAGTRTMPFTREIYVERDDFMEEGQRSSSGWVRGVVRLRFAFFITRQEVIKNAAGEVVELHCTYDPETEAGMPRTDARSRHHTLGVGSEGVRNGSAPVRPALHGRGSQQGGGRQNVH